MKKLILSTIFLNIIFTAFSQQSLTISFEARHYEGEDVGLDSILIKNITRSCDTMLYAPDTILYYNYFVGIGELPNYKLNSRPYPNPVTNGKSQLNISVFESGNINFELFNLFGVKFNSYSKQITPGNYTYGIEFGESGIFVLVENFNKQVKTYKIIVYQTNDNGIFSIKQTSFKRVNSSLKTQNNNNGFWYEPGDTLWYIAYAETPYGVTGSDVLEGVPINKEHRRFTIVEGLPCPEIAAVKYAGNLYSTVEIFGNCWFKENLNVGEMIVGDSNMKDNGIIEKYCYNNDLANCKEYGGLYQWSELMNYSENEATQGICPQGWHIPTSDEYFSLVEDIDGLACKERGNEHWLQSFNVGGVNTKGFTALGSGYRQNTSMFEMLKKSSAYHSSTLLTNNYVWYLELNKNNQIFFGSTLKKVGNSVRCVKDY